MLWISDDQEKNDCVPPSHVSVYAFVVDDLTELGCTGFACVYIASKKPIFNLHRFCCIQCC